MQKLKFRYSERAKKFEKKSTYLISVKKIWRFFPNFMVLSEYPKLLLLPVANSSPWYRQHMPVSVYLIRQRGKSVFVDLFTNASCGWIPCYGTGDVTGTI